MLFRSEGELELLRRIRDIVRLGRVIRIDADLLGQGTTFGQLDRNIAKISSLITFADEAAAARTDDANAIEQDEAMRRLGAAGTFWINDD